MSDEIRLDNPDLQVPYMEALFALCEAVEGGLTIGDMVQVMRQAVASGYDGMTIALAMTQAAVRLASDDPPVSSPGTP